MHDTSNTVRAHLWSLYEMFEVTATTKNLQVWIALRRSQPTVIGISWLFRSSGHIYPQQIKLPIGEEKSKSLDIVNYYFKSLIPLKKALHFTYTIHHKIICLQVHCPQIFCKTCLT